MAPVIFRESTLGGFDQGIGRRHDIFVCLGSAFAKSLLYQSDRVATTALKNHRNSSFPEVQSIKCPRLGTDTSGLSYCDWSMRQERTERKARIEPTLFVQIFEEKYKETRHEIPDLMEQILLHAYACEKRPDFSSVADIAGVTPKVKEISRFPLCWPFSCLWRRRFSAYDGRSVYQEAG
ncbi:hypothetical protein ACA910_000471 [Epithemia clementina (nom. ined.)]